MSGALPLIPQRPHEFLHNSGAPTVGLEISHNNADGGLRDVQLLGGRDEAEVPGDRNEDLQLLFRDLRKRPVLSCAGVLAATSTPAG